MGNLSNIKAVSAGGDFSLALKNDGTVWSWGRNDYGALGNNTADPFSSTADTHTPIQVHGSGDVGFLTNISAIAAGTYFCVALKNDGTVWSWGFNGYGQLGDNTNTDSWVPVQVKGSGGVGYLTNIIAIGAGDNHVLALKNDSTLWTWGRNNAGQLGDNSTTDRWTPVQVKGSGGVGNLTGVKMAMRGLGHSIALKNNGTVWSWGFNGYGELGDNTTTSKSAPVQVHGTGDVGFLTNIIAVSTKGSFNTPYDRSHCLALKNNGTVWAWGANLAGMLGDGTTTNRLTPVKVLNSTGADSLTNVVAIDAGCHHSFAVKNDGTLWAWGRNNKGQLGDGTITSRTAPVQITTSCPISLPIELLAFTAHWQDEKRNAAVAEWTTVTEINNDYFTVERSTDALHFDSIGTVKGTGNSKGSLNYSFFDNGLQPLIAQKKHLFYYRLKQTDFDGKYTHSNIVVLGLEKNFELVNLYPVPANQDVVSYMVISREKQTVKTEVIDFLGQNVISKTETVQEGINTLQLDVSTLSNAMY